MGYSERARGGDALEALIVGAVPGPRDFLFSGRNRVKLIRSRRCGDRPIFSRMCWSVSEVAQWFLQRMEGNVQSEVGPLRPAELLALVRKGEIQPETRLRKDNSAWFPAREVGGLFEAAVREVVQYYCPGCGTRVRQPPVTCPSCLRDLARGDAREVIPGRSAAQTVEDAAEEQRSESTQRSVKNWLTKKVNRRR